MIGDAKAVRGNERAAPAGIESDARFLEMLEPLRRRFEVVFLFELLERRSGEEPHSLIAERPVAQTDCKETKKNQREFSAHPVTIFE